MYLPDKVSAQLPSAEAEMFDKLLRINPDESRSGMVKRLIRDEYAKQLAAGTVEPPEVQ